ncbi:MAG: diaminopimelate epimerase [Candidatus Omnitrophica bacterium]|nr:diaminopimelate epimerase [Candidatus Omnitrophota bacterium]MDD5690940.1 diaminopimelate epimerase [Candidatus Omnitrophota bacterium]
MQKISFTKMVASGNDFVVIDKKPAGSLCALARVLCDRKFGAGADGLLLISKAKNTDLHMRIINADGSEAEMCGNGARCVALFSGKKKIKIRTLAGIINARVYGNQVKIQLTDPKQIKLDIPLNVAGRLIKVNFINTGVPHVVIFVDGLDKMDVTGIGCLIRWHLKFSPAGTNVNFVEVKDDNLIRIRTYERGVEGETLACGTGSTAAALIFALKNNLKTPVKVKTQSGEVLKIYFNKDDERFRGVWLEGSAKIAYKGEYYV